MDSKTILVEFLLAGFFAVACLRARGALVSTGKLRLIDFFFLSDRMERLKRSRWQWFSMVLLMLVIRLEQRRPLILELMLVLQFAVFIALPVRRSVNAGNGRR